MHTISQFGLYLLLSLPLIGAYAMLSTGIVVVFRASKVLNLAHGAMAMLPAYVVYALHERGLPLVLDVPLGVVAGALLGAAVERFFVRPLGRQGGTAQTVGTIAVYGLVVATIAQVFGSSSHPAARVFPDGGVSVGGTQLQWGQLGLFVVALVSAAGFFALFRFTRIGLAMRGAAENPVAAGLMGVSPEAMARLAWALGGGLAGLAGILLASVTNLNPYSLSLQMLPAFVAALIGGLGSLPGALAGAAVVGTAQGIVPAFSLVPGARDLSSQVGMPQLVLTVLALVVMYRRGQKFSLAGGGGAIAGSDAVGKPRSAYDPALVRPRGGARRLRQFVLLAALLAWPFAAFPSFLPVDQFSLLGDGIVAAEYFIAAASLVMLTGWVGQISLAQASFVGIGAFSSALLGRHLGVGWPWSLLVVAIVSAAVCAGLGLVALRVRGLYLAVATLIFAWMADSYLFVVPWFAGTGGSATVKTQPAGIKGTFPFFDVTDRRTFYFIVLAVASAVFFGLLNLRDSKTGRAFAAVRGSETAAAAFGIDVVRTKLFAFALAGGIAGVAGNLIVTNQVTVVPDSFNLQASLLFLAIAVVGGLRSLGGSVSASLVFAGLNEVFFRVPALGRYLQLVSALLLAGVLLFYPGGLAAIPASLTGARSRLRGLLDLLPRVRFAPSPAPAAAVAVAAAAANVVPIARAASVTESAPVAAPAAIPEQPDAATYPTDSAPQPWPALIAANITVRFGGLTAVDDASLKVEAGQIVGLIGPNGAGKTTLFNAISGLNSPTSGTVHLFGNDVTRLPVHERAAHGLGRTFQVIQLFGELTVFENLLVATHLHNKTGSLEHIVATARSVRAELEAEDTCRRTVDFLGLADIADRPVAGLPFGTLRMVELGRALVTGAPLVMLDEPASGLDNVETDRMTDVLRRVRAELGLSILLIEHDVRMVTSVTDYMYVLDRGRLIAEGTPAQVQRHDAVVKAYLGEPVVEAVG